MQTPNILEQISSYDPSSVDNQILQLKRELREQKELNEVLKQKKTTEQIEKINEFITRNGGQIDYHLSELETVTAKIKSVVHENESLQSSDEKFQEVLESEQCKDVSKKLAAIKKMKNEIQFFLSEQGISPSLAM